MKIKGIAASDGISIAKVYRLETVELKVTKELIENTNDELKKLEKNRNMLLN